MTRGRFILGNVSLTDRFPGQPSCRLSAPHAIGKQISERGNNFWRKRVFFSCLLMCVFLVCVCVFEL